MSWVDSFSILPFSVKQRCLGEFGARFQLKPVSVGITLFPPLLHWVSEPVICRHRNAAGELLEERRPKRDATEGPGTHTQEVKNRWRAGKASNQRHGGVANIGKLTTAIQERRFN